MVENTNGIIDFLTKVKLSPKDMIAAGELGFVERFLTLWIFLSMLTGVLLGYYVPAVKEKLGSSKLADVNIPMAVGLIWMMYPILCKVRYEMLHKILAKTEIWKTIGYSIMLNWIIAPSIMVVLGWATLPDLVEYRSGLVLVGTARCIAMVLVWNRLAGGDEEFCAIIVAINSMLQVGLYVPLSYLYVVTFSRGTHMGISMWPVIQSVLVFLGLPQSVAIITRVVVRKISPKFYETKFLKIVGPTLPHYCLFCLRLP